jgi:hypothetical protein
MLCIYQVDEIMNETIVNLLDSPKYFLDTVKDKISNELNVKLIESLTSNDIEKYDCFVEGYYLLINDSIIELVHKIVTIHRGYFSTTKSVSICILVTWKLISFGIEHSLTENFGSMVIKNSSSSTNFTDKVFHFKANNIDISSDIVSERDNDIDNDTNDTNDSDYDNDYDNDNDSDYDNDNDSD